MLVKRAENAIEMLAGRAGIVKTSEKRIEEW